MAGSVEMATSAGRASVVREPSLAVGIDGVVILFTAVLVKLVFFA